MGIHSACIYVIYIYIYIQVYDLLYIYIYIEIYIYIYITFCSISLGVFICICHRLFFHQLCLDLLELKGWQRVVALLTTCCNTALTWWRPSRGKTDAAFILHERKHRCSHCKRMWLHMTKIIKTHCCREKVQWTSVPEPPWTKMAVEVPCSRNVIIFSYIFN